MEVEHINFHSTFSIIEDRKSDYSLGDHFELDIRKANLSMTGWYRCIRGGDEKEPKRHIARAYYLDVVPLNEFPVEMVGWVRLVY